MDRLIKLLKSNPSSGILNSSFVQSGSTPSALSSFLMYAPWIIDLGASNDMTSLSNLFKS